MERSITIGTPCYNEEQSLPAYFERITQVRAELAAQGWAVDLVLIDDGSSDGTTVLLQGYAGKHADTRLVRHPRNLGYGAGIKTALAVAHGEWVVFVDADSNYDQRLILDLIRRVDPAVDVVNVSILAPGGAVGFPWYRLLLSSSASALYRVLLPRLTRGVYTMTCGFRLYRRRIVPQVFPQADNFVATAEIMVRALLAGASVVELPASNSRREHGVSKMKVLRVTLGHLRVALQALFGRLGPPGVPAAHLRRVGLSASDS